MELSILRELVIGHQVPLLSWNFIAGAALKPCWDVLAGLDLVRPQVVVVAVGCFHHQWYKSKKMLQKICLHYHGEQCRCSHQSV